MTSDWIQPFLVGTRGDLNAHPTSRDGGRCTLTSHDITRSYLNFESAEVFTVLVLADVDNQLEAYVFASGKIALSRKELS